MRLTLAFRAFFAVLFRPDAARFIERVLESGQGKPREKKSKRSEKTESTDANQPSISETPPPKSKSIPSFSVDAGRSDALTLLSSLQREARFLDLVNESLDGYSDAQVGAAARDVIRDCGKVVQRCFQIKPLLAETEGSQISVTSQSSAFRYRIIGKSVAEGQSLGTLLHPGWQASIVQLPQWTGAKEDQMVLTPAEVEIT